MKDLGKKIQKTRQEMRKEERLKKRKKLKEKQKREKPVDGSTLETASVMFIEQTPFGELTKRLQKCEDMLG